MTRPRINVGTTRGFQRKRRGRGEPGSESDEPKRATAFEEIKSRPTAENLTSYLRRINDPLRSVLAGSRFATEFPDN